MKLFRGRINRATYLVGLIMVYAYAWITLAIFVSIHYLPPSNLEHGIVLIAGVAPSLIYYLSISAQRNHDLGWSVYGDKKLLLGEEEIVQLWISGDPRKNKYGKPPKRGIDWKALIGLA
jgi:uncharacterized membrane protein YhaH (DUF805 family)